MRDLLRKTLDLSFLFIYRLCNHVNFLHLSFLIRSDQKERKRCKIMMPLSSVAATMD